MGIILTSTGLPLLSSTGLIASRAAAAGAGGGASPGGGGAPSSVMWGWDPSIDLGADGDLFVDASVRASGDGTSLATAKKTITEAIKASTAGDVIRVKAGAYRERIVPKSGTSIMGYGTDKPIITAGEVLTGLVQCGSADASVVGSNYANIYKVGNFPLTNLSRNSSANADFRCLNLHEHDAEGVPQMLDWAVTWAGGDLDDRWFYASMGDWMEADSVEVVNGKIQSLTSQALFESMTDAALLAKGVRLSLITTPNSQVWTEIASIDRATNKIVPANLTVTYESNPKKNKFLLLNVAGNLQQGEWAYVDNGDGTCNVYVWPRNPANVNGGIEYSARTNCIDIGFTNNVTLKGLNCIMSAGAGRRWNGPAISATNSGGTGPNIVVEHCRMAGVYATSGGSAYAISLEVTTNATFKHNTVQDIRGYGVFILGDANNPPENTIFYGPYDIQYNHFERLFSTPCRFAGSQDAVVAFNMVKKACWAGHANKTNAYQQCNKILWWGNVFEDCSGYLTWQESSGIHIAFNYLPATRDSTGNSRSLVDQGNGTYPPSGWPTPPDGAADPGLIFNNTCIPEPSKVGTFAKGFFVTAANSVNDTNTYSVANNIFHNWDVSNPACIAEWGGNLQVGHGGTFSTNDFTTTPTELWVSPSTNDFNIKADAPVRQLTGADLTSYIAYLKSKFGDRIADADWNKDCFGNTFDPANPPIGCIADYDYSSFKNPIWGR